MGNEADWDDQETRSRLLRVAARLFADRGFNHVSVRGILRRKGCRQRLSSFVNR